MIRSVTQHSYFEKKPNKWVDNYKKKQEFFCWVDLLETSLIAKTKQHVNLLK
jgi:hypothetical protein